MISAFEAELQELLNKYGIDNKSEKKDVPGFELVSLQGICFCSYCGNTTVLSNGNFKITNIKITTKNSKLKGEAP